MNFDLTDDQKSHSNALPRVRSQDEVRPRAEEMDREGRISVRPRRARWPKLGLLRPALPRRIRRRGRRYDVSYALAVMEIARADASTAITLAAARVARFHAVLSFRNRRTESSAISFRSRAARCCGASGLRSRRPAAMRAEPARGPSCAATSGRSTGRKRSSRTAGTDRHRRHDDHGRHRHRTERGRLGNLERHRPAGVRPGLRGAKKYRKMGWRASDTRELVFDDARRAGGERCSAERGEGLKQFLDDPRRRPHLGRGALRRRRDGRVRRSAFATRRTVISSARPISKFQAIQFKLADMLMEIEHAKLMVLRSRLGEG